MRIPNRSSERVKYRYRVEEGKIKEDSADGSHRCINEVAGSFNPMKYCKY
jgi:hypothetical protein